MKLTKRQNETLRNANTWIKEAIRRGVSKDHIVASLYETIQYIENENTYSTEAMYNELPETWRVCFKQRQDGTYMKTHKDLASVYELIFPHLRHPGYVAKCRGPAAEAIAWLWGVTREQQKVSKK